MSASETNPDQWADKVLDDVIIAWSEHGHSAGIEAIQAAFAEREARLVGALEELLAACNRHHLKAKAVGKAESTLAALKDRT